MFADLGGFQDWPILEDLDFGRRLRAYGEIGLVDDPVKTSARCRFCRPRRIRAVASLGVKLGLFAAAISASLVLFAVFTNDM